jgi:hypothetical protein
MTNDSFISYSRSDQAFIRVFDGFLRDVGLNTWYDERCLLLGMKWKDVVEDEIPNSRTFITCMSAAGMQRTGYFHVEQKLAVDRALSIPPNKLFILPVTLGDCEIPRIFRQYHVVNLAEVGAIELLLASVGEALGRSLAATEAQIAATREALLGHLNTEGVGNSEIMARFFNDPALSFEESMKLVERIANSTDTKRLEHLLKLRSCDYLSFAEQAGLDLAIDSVRNGMRASGLQQAVRDAEWSRIMRMKATIPTDTEIMRIAKYARYTMRKNRPEYDQLNQKLADLLIAPFRKAVSEQQGLGVIDLDAPGGLDMARRILGD